MPLWIAVALLGVVEGITEFLPVSSTGHLLLTEHFLLARHWLQSHMSDLFNIVIQSGAVIAVLPLFPDRLHQFVYKWRERSTQDYLLKIAVAFVITGIGGYLMDKHGFRLPETITPIAWALLIGGIGFIAVELWLGDKPLKKEVTWPIVIAVGVGQLIAAAFPGTSRSGSTILLALLLGLNRVAATEFTFLVGIPTMLAAGGWKILKELRHPAPGASENWGMVALGFIVAAVVSFFAVKWLLRYIQTHTFILFGWYRIGVAALIAALLLLPATHHPLQTGHPVVAPGKSAVVVRGQDLPAGPEVRTR